MARSATRLRQYIEDPNTAPEIRAALGLVLEHNLPMYKVVRLFGSSVQAFKAACDGLITGGSAAYYEKHHTRIEDVTAAIRHGAEYGMFTGSAATRFQTLCGILAALADGKEAE
jgi:hypothetical protein|nr:MAG TPA: hypothetical protein [Caudoviricetes sp.]